MQTSSGIWANLAAYMGDKKRHARAFGLVVRELRLNKGITQDQLAESADTERSHISSIERGERGPNIATLFSIADGLDVSPSELIALVEKKLDSNRRN